jgi:hypothetical protein
MLVYSQWRPEGGYDYFETDEIAPLGNDLGVPHLEVVNGIGVPSVEAGRPIPAGARHVGEGALPIGVVAPMDRSQVGEESFLDQMLNVPPWVAFLCGAAFIGVVWFTVNRYSRKS